MASIYDEYAPAAHGVIDCTYWSSRNACQDACQDAPQGDATLPAARRTSMCRGLFDLDKAWCCVSVHEPVHRLPGAAIVTVPDASRAYILLTAYRINKYTRLGFGTWFDLSDQDIGAITTSPSSLFLALNFRLVTIWPSRQIPMTARHSARHARGAALRSFVATDSTRTAPAHAQDVSRLRQPASSAHARQQADLLGESTRWCPLKSGNSDRTPVLGRKQAAHRPTPINGSPRRPYSQIQVSREAQTRSWAAHSTSILTIRYMTRTCWTRSVTMAHRLTGAAAVMPTRSSRRRQRQQRQPQQGQCPVRIGIPWVIPR